MCSARRVPGPSNNRNTNTMRYEHRAVCRFLFSVRSGGPLVHFRPALEYRIFQLLTLSAVKQMIIIIIIVIATACMYTYTDINVRTQFLIRLKLPSFSDRPPSPVWISFWRKNIFHRICAARNVVLQAACALGVSVPIHPDADIRRRPRF